MNADEIVGGEDSPKSPPATEPTKALPSDVPEPPAVRVEEK